MPSADDDRPTNSRGLIPNTSLGSEGMREDRLDDDLDAEGLDVRRIFAAIMRQRWLIALMAIIGLGAGAAAGRFRRPVYTAQATIGIEVTAPGGATPIGGQQLLQAQGWVDLLRSYQVLDEVVRRQRLFLEVIDASQGRLFAGFGLKPAFTPGLYTARTDSTGTSVILENENGEVLEERAFGDSLGLTMGFAWQPQGLEAGSVMPFRVRMPRDAAVRLSEDLSAILPAMNGYFLRIELSGADPEFTAATVNAIAARFIEVATAQKRDKLTIRTTVLQRQLETASLEKRENERALQSFRVRTITLPNDRGNPISAGLAQTRDPVFAAYFQLRSERESLVNERAALQRALATPSDSAPALIEALSAIPSVASSSELSSALTRLGDKRTAAAQMRLGFSASHPPLVRLEQEIREIERNDVRARAAVLLAALDQRVNDFDGRITAQSRELQQIPPRALEEARLETELEISNDLFSTLRTAYEQARLAELSALPDVRIVDPAEVPTTPTTDQLLLILVGGLIGGVAAGLGLALLLDRLDPRIRYPGQVSRDLGLHILGALPMIPEASKRSRSDREESHAHLTEALRTVRMNLLYAHGAAGPLITTVTSPGASDGKSFLSSHLAKTHAAAGARTLLIDGDTRRGVLHRDLGVPRKPGLLDHLAGLAPLEEVLHTLPTNGLVFMPAGTRRAGGPEMLASTRMAQLLLLLRSRFDVIIIDSPPLGAGVDALILGSLAGSMLLVVRTGRTDRELAAVKLGELQRLPIRLLGAVLNDVRAEGIYRYYSYLPGYRSEDEVGDLAADRLRLGKG